MEALWGEKKRSYGADALRVIRSRRRSHRQFGGSLPYFMCVEYDVWFRCTESNCNLIFRAYYYLMTFLLFEVKQ